MRRSIINLLAVVGTVSLLGAALFFVADKLGATDATIIVLGPDQAPLANVPVFLDRGGAAIERYTTDAKGRLRFPLERREYRRALWLICAPGGIPMVGERSEGLLGPAAYQYTALRGSTWGFYRSSGWRGPVPRECPVGTDSLGWRFAPAAGKNPDAFTLTEPAWPRP